MGYIVHPATKNLDSWTEHICNARVDTEFRTQGEFTICKEGSKWYIGAEGINGPEVYFCCYCGEKLP